MKLWLFALSLLLLIAGYALPANAASFECPKAATPFEKTICGDPDLSAADSTLNVAYKTAVGGLTSEATAKMLDGQRAWLKFLDASCADAMLPREDSIETERASCLLNAYTARIKTLEASRMLEGLRFYNVDDYRAAPDPDGENYYKVSSHTQSLPRLDGGGNEATAFNAYITEAEKNLPGDFSLLAKDPDLGEDTDLSAKVANVTPGRIDLEVNSYWYGHGAAHGNYAITYLHFLRKEQRGLKAEDIFKGQNWEQHLADAALARLKADRGENLFDIDQKDLEQIVANPNRWDFNAEGFVVQFQPYEVASYADGAIKAVISWNDLTDDLAEGAEDLVVNDF